MDRSTSASGLRSDFIRQNEALPCKQSGCPGLRYGGWQLCHPHALIKMEIRRQAGIKATATKRARYPDKYYAPGERKDWRWQQFAQSAVHRAKKAGILPDLSTGEYACTDCAAPASEYDHRDYSKPLDVAPVCRRCNLRRGKAAFPTAQVFPKLPPDQEVADAA